ncbi:hypothetical protein BD309DRAFT_1017834 [Dichomitus squalens]|nr:hypothetical protein BD309DRAFT_1017834 [Dichomitus squalens]
MDSNTDRSEVTSDSTRDDSDEVDSSTTSTTSEQSREGQLQSPLLDGEQQSVPPTHSLQADATNSHIQKDDHHIVNDHAPQALLDGDRSVPLTSLSPKISQSDGKVDTAARSTVRSDDAQIGESAIDQLLKRDEELWYEDGNLVLIANNVEFRLFKGPLVAQSLVFKDMLSLPQPPSLDNHSREHVSGPSYATVHLHGDSLPDLRHFLRMFVGHSIPFGGLSDPTYHQLSSVIRLAHKYQCEKLLGSCVDYLKRFYHDNFEAWRDSTTCITPPNLERIHAIGVVNLARLLGQDKMLPGALMACCLLETGIVDGFEREDGTRETLSNEDLARCMVGRAKLLEANVQATLRILHPEVHEDCMRRDTCGEVLLKLLKTLEEGTVLYSFRWDWTWTAYVEWADTRRELCPRCFEMLGKEGRQKDQHSEIFNRLPAMMGIDVAHWGKTPEEIEALTQVQTEVDNVNA